MRSLVKALALYFLISFAISAQPIWEVQNSGVTVNLRAVSFCNAMVGTAVGDSGVIVHTTNGGKNWYRQSSGDSLRFNGIVQSDSLKAIVVGANGLIVKSTDGGVTWIHIASGTMQNIYSIDLYDSLYGAGTAYSGFIVTTTDGGDTWQSDSIGFGNFYALALPSRNTIIAVGVNADITKLIRSTDAGKSWSEQDFSSFITAYEAGPDIPSVIFHDSLNGWMVGDNFWYNFWDDSWGDIPFVYHSTDGGASWNRQFTGAQINQSFKGLIAIGFIHDSIGIAVGEFGTMYEIINSKTDSSWFPIPSPTDSMLLAISVVDDSIMTVVGDKGTILRMAGYKPVIVNESNVQPASFSLSQNYPNPFGSALTMISYTLQSSGITTLKVYDLLGEEVATPVSGWQAAGVHSVSFNASRLPEGAYIYRLQEGSSSQTKIMYVER